MKKSLKTIFVSMLFVITMPLAMLLTGCGATPSNEVLGVYFVSPIYDEATGQAVFEVDTDVDTKLDYKMNPSTGSGYAVTYKIKECPENNLSRFTLKDGVINVSSNKFEQIRVDITVNGYSDTCIVRLKKYPESMFLLGVDGQTETKNLEISVNAQGSYTISPFGRFSGVSGTYVKPLLEYDYDFKVETADRTVVDVPIKNRLKINVVAKKPSSTTVTVSLLNSAKQVLHKVTVKVNVVLNASKASVILDGSYRFINMGDKITVDLSTIPPEADGSYALDYQLFVFNTDGRKIDGVNISTICRVSETRYVTVSKTADQIIIEDAPEDFTFKMKLWTNLINDNGTPFVVSFDVEVKV